jgi:hypothetical protein
MELGYQKDLWFHDIPTDVVNQRSEKDYNTHLKLLMGGHTFFEPNARDSPVLGAMYRVVLFIAGRMLSRVWHPSEGYYEIKASDLHKRDLNRILLVVTQLRMEIESCKGQGWHLEVSHTNNIKAVDRILMDLYAEGAVCIKLAEEYYAMDDETQWKPKFHDMMRVLWSAHVFIEEQHINRHPSRR